MEPICSLPYLCPPPVPILSQLHPVPTTLSHFLKIRLNIILQSTSGSPHWSLPSGFPNRTLCTTLPSPICATRPTHLILFDFTNHTILGKEYRSLSSSLCKFNIQNINYLLDCKGSCQNLDTKQHNYDSTTWQDCKDACHYNGHVQSY